MKTADQLEPYQSSIQNLSVQTKYNKISDEDLQRYIANARDNAHDNPVQQEFLKGEYAFFSGKYQLALKHYLHSKSIPNFQLYCYRTSAYVSKARGDIAKAITFAKEALALSPHDYPSLTILEELLTLDQKHDAARQVRSQIDALDATLLAAHVPIPNESDHSPETTLTEPEMHTPPGFLASLDSETPVSTEHLTNRLYALKPFSSKQSPFTSYSEKAGTAPESKRYNAASASNSPYTLESSPQFTNQSAARHASLTTESEQTESLEQSIKSFQKRQEAGITQYLEQLNRRTQSNDQCLYVLHGYPLSTNEISADNALATELLLTQKDRRTSGGYYIRWNGKGIVINPGVNFLEHFHHQGLHIRDIDYVIVTNANPDTYADIKEIYELNYQLNNASAELQIIHYYLSQKAYQTLSPALKPNFKQERDTVRCLELFLDSPEVEKLELFDGVALHYFPIAGQSAPLNDLMPKGDKSAPIPASLGIRLDLRSNEQGQENKTVRLGYISGAAWSPLLAHHLGTCDVLIAGFGSTNVNDYSKLKYNDSSLGYFGSYSLLEEVHPQLFLSSEFNGNQGDIRIEVIKLMRQEYAHAYPQARQIPALLPADPTLFVDLQTLNIQCSITKAPIIPSQVRIVKSQASFGNLRYLSPGCCA